MTRRVAAALVLAALTSACSADAATSTTTTTTTTTTTSTATATATATETTGDSIAANAEHPCGGGVPPATYDHVIWIWMENHSVAQVIGQPGAPFVTGLAAACGQATNYRSVGSPSLPNYIGATSGDTWGIGDDAGPGAHQLKVDNIFRQVRASGRRAMSFEEAMPDRKSVV